MIELLQSLLQQLQAFHFLRPIWLFGLIALPLFWWAQRSKFTVDSDWANTISPELLKHLLPTASMNKGPNGGRQNSSRNKNPKRLLLPLIVLCLLALSGPTWEQKPTPVVQINDDLVIVIDLSLSMLATDLAPKRLTRAKQKLQDMLALRTEGTTALIAFSGDSHVVTPLTDDTNTLLANLPALDPFMMPVIGSRPDIAVEQALELLQQGKASKGRIVMLTDGIESHQGEKIQQLISDSPISVSLSILAVGTAAGGPIDMPERGYLKDKGAVVIPKMDFNFLASVAGKNGGTAVEMSLDDRDINALDISGEGLLNDISDSTESQIDKRFDSWVDSGIWLLFLIVPVVLIAHRQGAFLLVLFVVFVPQESYAVEWVDLWQTKDQQAQKLMTAGEIAKAAEVFDSDEHKAHAQYRNKQYQESAANYSKQTNANGQFNQGNALAQQQDFEGAIEAYERALELEPELEDAAFNKALVEEFLAQQQEQQQESENSDSESDKEQDQSQDEQSGEQSDDKSGKKSDKQSDSQDGEQSQDSQNKPDEDSQSDSEQQSEQQQSEGQEEQSQAEQEDGNEDPEGEAENETGSAAANLQEVDDLTEEERQSFEQWMRRVPDDPSGLLRRKFEQQSRERNRTRREEGEPLW